MQDISLQDIIKAHTDVFSAHAQEFLPMICFLLLHREGPVSPERLATAMHWTRAEVEAFLHASGLVVNDHRTIQIMPGGGCALDTLLLALLTGQPAHVVRTCPASGRPIRLTVTEQGINELDPPGTVLSLRLPNAETNVSNTQATICTYGHFFADREAASTWPGLHPEAVLLSGEDAFHVACAIANTARKYVEITQI